VKLDKHAFSIYQLTFKIAYVIILLFALGCAVYVYFYPSGNWFQEAIFFAVVAVSTYVAVWINLGTTWAVRNKMFRQISIQKISNSIAVNGLRVFFGMFKMGTLGLVLGTFLGSLLSIGVFVQTYFSEKKKYNQVNHAKQFRVLSKQHRDFPMLNLPHAMLDMGVELLIAACILFYFGKEMFGYYSFAYLMLRVPLMLIGQSVGQFYFNQISTMHNQQQPLLGITHKTVKVLFLVGLIPFALLGFWGEELFELIFGTAWKYAGQIASILAISLFLNFIVSPISTLCMVLSKQKFALIIGIVSACFQLFIFGLIPMLLPKIDFQWLLIFNAGFLSTLYVIVYFFYILFAKKH
jgi:O-antigen/teichoic acid export membrane protein